MKTKFYSLSMALVVLWLFSSIQLSAQVPTITLLQPTNAGIEWTAGGTYVISWTDNFQSTVDVLVSADNGVTYTPLASGVTGSTYYWNTSGFALGTQYKIKVQSHLSPSVYFDESLNAFTLSDQTGGSITLEQPTGGETWAEGNTYVISWYDNLTAPVKVELLYSGTSHTLSASTTGSTYYWTIPTGYASSTVTYQIKVSSTVAGATTTPATSGAFTISASAGTTVEVLQPNGGEKWQRGTKHVISWIDDIPEAVNIELWKAGVYNSSIHTNVVGSTYVWTIPSTLTPANDYSVKVYSILDPSILDHSNANFSITASAGTTVTVIQPNGGESWARGTSHLISWNDDMTEPVNIELWKAGVYNSSIHTNVVGSTYVWTIPSTLTPANDYSVKVVSTLDPSILDHSNANFSITASSGTTVTVIQPNGGESWARNTSHLISWIDDIPEPVNIELWKAGVYNSSIHTNVVGSTYVWSIPSGQTAATDYTVRVYSTLDGTLQDVSNANFSITASAGTYVTVLQPNGGENWVAGRSYLISWIDDLPEAVNIELWKGGVYNSSIHTNLVGSTYVWTIPSTQTPGTDYSVKVVSTLDPTILDHSNADFTIFAPAVLTPYPNPANNKVTINMANMGESSSYTVQVYDRFNNEVGEYNTSSNSLNIATTNLVSGIYFVVVTSDNNRATTKIIVQH